MAAFVTFYNLQKTSFIRLLVDDDETDLSPITFNSVLNQALETEQDTATFNELAAHVTAALVQKEFDTVAVVGTGERYAAEDFHYVITFKGAAISTDAIGGKHKVECLDQYGQAWTSFDKNDVATSKVASDTSKDKEYTVRIHRTGNHYDCTCQGWVFSKNFPKSCKHIQREATRLGILNQYAKSRIITA